MIAVNLMSVTRQDGIYAGAAVQAGMDVLILGAGFPLALPQYVKGHHTEIASVVSSQKEAKVMLKIWDRRYGRYADFLVMENPFPKGIRTIHAMR